MTRAYEYQTETGGSKGIQAEMWLIVLILTSLIFFADFPTFADLNSPLFVSNRTGEVTQIFPNPDKTLTVSTCIPETFKVDNVKLDDLDGLIFDSEGNMIISDEGNNRIVKVKGKFVNPTPGCIDIDSNNAQVLATGVQIPKLITINKDDDLIIAEGKTGKIFLLRGSNPANSLETLLNLGPPVLGSLGVKALRTLGVTLDKDENLYIGDWADGTIKKLARNPDRPTGYENEATLYGTFPPGDFNLDYEVPAGMHIDPITGDLYVTTNDLTPTQEAKFKGKLFKIPHGTTTPIQASKIAGGFKSPDGVAIETDGDIFIAQVAIGALTPDLACVKIIEVSFGKTDPIDLVCGLPFPDDLAPLSGAGSPRLFEFKITKSGANIDATIEYTVVLNNLGTISQGDNPGPELEDTIPENTIFVPESESASSGNISFDSVANKVLWNGSIVAGASVTIKFRVRLKDGVCNAEVSNQAILNFDSNEDGINESSQVSDDPNTQIKDDATINTLTNLPPVAVANQTAQAKVGETIQLDGSASSDPEGDELTYSWVITEAPPGSALLGKTFSGVIATFVADKVGRYVATLTVSDGCNSTDSPGPPTFVVPIIPEIFQEQACDTFTLDVGDVNGDLDLQWELIQAPDGIRVPQTISRRSKISLLLTKPGLYRIRLTMRDPATGDSATVETSINVFPSLGCGFTPGKTDFDIGLNGLVHQIYEIIVDVTNARQLISQKRPVSLIEDAIDRALQVVEGVNSDFAELFGLLDNLDETLTDFIATVLAELENPDVTPTQMALIAKAKAKLEVIQTTLLELRNELDSLRDTLDTGDPDANDVRSALEAAHEAVTNDDLAAARAALNTAYLRLRTARREQGRILAKQRVIMKRFVEISAILPRIFGAVNSNLSVVPATPMAQAIQLNTKSPVSLWVVSQQDGSFVFRAENADVKTMQLEVFKLNGERIAQHSVLGQLVSFKPTDAHGRRLANGVYLVVITVKGENQATLLQHVHKLTILQK